MSTFRLITLTLMRYNIIRTINKNIRALIALEDINKTIRIRFEIYSYSKILKENIVKLSR